MSWFKERLSAVHAALGPRRYMLAPLFGAVVGFVDWVISKLEDVGLGGLIGVPSWAIGVFAALILVAWWLNEHVMKLRRELAPKLSLQFEPEAGCVVVTPVKYRDRDGKVTHETRAISIRGLVTAASNMSVRRCTAYVTDVKKKDVSSGLFVGTAFIDDLQLPWALISTPEIEIPSGVRRYFGILMVEEGTNQLKWTDGLVYSLRHRDLFADHTIYRLRLAVVGEGITEEIVIEVQWSGQWDQVKACKVAGA